MSDNTKIAYEVIDWDQVPQRTEQGQTGETSSRTKQYNGLRIRTVDYGAGYLADHWCQKGHIVYCIEGEFETELESGERFILSAGMSYVVSDNLSSHRSSSKDGVRLLIIDGDFLK